MLIIFINMTCIASDLATCIPNDFVIRVEFRIVRLREEGPRPRGIC